MSDNESKKQALLKVLRDKDPNFIENYSRDMSERKKAVELNPVSSYISPEMAIAPVVGAIMVKEGITTPSGKPIKTIEDVLEYVNRNNPLYHSTSRKRAEAIHKSGLYPEAEGGAIETYGYAPSQIKNLSEAELEEIPDVIRNKSYTPVSWMGDDASLGYAASSISKEKKGTASIGDATKQQLLKESGIAIIPRNEDIYYNKGNPGGGLDLRKSTDIDTPFRDYDEALDSNPFIEPSDYISSRVQSPDITLTEKDAVDFIERKFPEDHTFQQHFKTKKPRTVSKVGGKLLRSVPMLGLGLAAAGGMSESVQAGEPLQKGLARGIAESISPAESTGFSELSEEDLRDLQFKNEPYNRETRFKELRKKLGK